MGTREELRKLPSVDRLLTHPVLQGLEREAGHEIVVEAVREALSRARQAIQDGQPCPSVEDLVEAVQETLAHRLRPSLTPVINATGVIIHTNLGRAPLSVETVVAMWQIGCGYSNLEYSLEEGRRGSRYVHAEELLCRLTGAEAALVVNNNAGAVLLILATLAAGREVVISRGQLIEIGGGFRIPDVLRQSGARLVEVGTTNRTRLSDYREALTSETALLLWAHHSNFRIVGFAEEPSLADLVALGREVGVPVVGDLGSGSLLPTEPYGLAHEPTVQESVATGAALVSFSGDKLLGGPQAGIILGQRDLVERLRRFPLTRALRVDKTTLAGLQATLLHYLRGEAVEKIPVWAMIAASPQRLRSRARSLARRLAAQGLPVQVVPGESAVGGGSLPGQTLPTFLVAIAAPSPDKLARRLRLGMPPVVARIEDDRLVLDLRTVIPGEDPLLLEAILHAWRADDQGPGD